MDVARPNWDRLSIMVVDDNAFVRKLIEGTIRAFGIRNVVGEGGGAAAIARLKLSRTDPVAAGIGDVDMVLADYLMPEVDGLLFLRWLRTDEAAPDRFVPFVMVSGAADQAVVRQARDLGATEFLAKPFSARGLAERLMHVVNQPRPFVLAPGFFGPDRRRAVQAAARERRSTDEAGLQVLHHASGRTTLREDVRAIQFRLPNRLRDKIGAYRLRGRAAFDPALVEAAEARIQEMVGDYAAWAARAIEEMAEARAALEAGEGDPVKLFTSINIAAHELRGQGGIFDYPLITRLGASLYAATRDVAEAATPNRLELIAAHIDAIRSVFKNKIKGDGGEVGQALLQEIDAAVRRGW